MAKFGSVDEYFHSIDPTQASTMRKIIAAVEHNFPDTTVKLAWNVPQIQIAGHYVLGLSAAKKHISIAPWSERVMALYASQLASLSPTKGMFRVPVDWDIDEKLLINLVHARCEEWRVRD